jgi:hypothetical protein
MSVPSPERLASIAISIAHEVYSGGCICCEPKGYEMHELYGRQMRKTLGAAVCILGATLAPLCPICHIKWAGMSLENQLNKLSDIFACDEVLRIAQREQLIAIKARCHVCK